MPELQGSVLKTDNTVILLVDDWIYSENLFIRKKEDAVPVMFEVISAESIDNVPIGLVVDVGSRRASPRTSETFLQLP